jgi:hypothetical protein
MPKIRDKMRTVLILCGLFFALAFKHPFYLSVTDLKYNAKEKALQGSVKLFVNDIEGVLKKLNGKTVDLIHPKDSIQAKLLLAAYLKKHLSITINTKALNYTLLGFEREEEAIWAYIEIKNCPLPKKVVVENSLLYDHLSGQSNIVHLEVNGEKKSGKVDNPEKLLLFEF